MRFKEKSLDTFVSISHCIRFWNKDEDTLFSLLKKTNKRVRERQVLQAKSVCGLDGITRQFKYENKKKHYKVHPWLVFKLFYIWRFT